MAAYTLRCAATSPRRARGPTGRPSTSSSTPPSGPRRAPPGQGPRRRLARGPLLLPGGDLRLLRGEDQRPVDARLQDPDRRGRRHEADRDGGRQRRAGDEPIIGRADGEHAGDQGPGHRHGVDPLGEVPPRHPVAARRPATRPSASTSSPPESMVDVTQSIACIQCGACVSSCLSMEADPDFIGPAALAKAYRFVGDPRDGETTRAPLRPRPGPARDLRLHPLLLVHRRLPEGRRADGPDHAPAPPPADEQGIKRPQQRPQPRGRLREDHREEGHARRVAAAAGVLRARGQGQADADGGAIKGLLGSIPTAIRGIRTGKMRSLPKLIPGVHPKLPGRRPGPGEADLRARRGAPERAQPLHHGRGGGRARARRAHRRGARRGGERPTAEQRERVSEKMKLAYWPGCVSRGFTTELHGSMALVAERLGIELVTLDRANCCGAGVIAEHNQELADTLNARTFALAQQTGLAMMNICSTCQGAQSECQQRLDADSAYRAHINEALAGEGLSYDEGQGRLRQQELPLAAGRGLRARPPRRARSSARSRACGSGPSTAATWCARSRASATTSTPTATSTWRR